MKNVRLSPNSLLEKIRRGEVDTVLAVFPDMLGRWMGKRVTGSFFADSVARKGAPSLPLPSPLCF